MSARHARASARRCRTFPPIDDYDVGPRQYLDLIRKASEAVDIPIIASLNGVSERGWVDFAKEMEDAGASGIELNVYYIPDRDVPIGRRGRAAVRRRPVRR